jgi:hypothetical protein
VLEWISPAGAAFVGRSGRQLSGWTGSGGRLVLGAAPGGDDEEIARFVELEPVPPVAGHDDGLAREQPDDLVRPARPGGPLRPPRFRRSSPRRMPTPARESVESSISGSFLLSEDRGPPHRFRRLFNDSVESPNVESPGRLPEIGVYQGFCPERTTGLEPARPLSARAPSCTRSGHEGARCHDERAGQCAGRRNDSRSHGGDGSELRRRGRRRTLIGPSEWSPTATSSHGLWPGGRHRMPAWTA